MNWTPIKSEKEVMLRGNINFEYDWSNGVLKSVTCTQSGSPDAVRFRMDNYTLVAEIPTPPKYEDKYFVVCDNQDAMTALGPYDYESAAQVALNGSDIPNSWAPIIRKISTPVSP